MIVKSWVCVCVCTEEYGDRCIMYFVLTTVQPCCGFDPVYHLCVCLPSLHHNLERGGRGKEGPDWGK